MNGESTNLKLRLWLFGILLLTTIALVIIFASGTLRFGLQGPFIFILYIIAGLLAAVTCYGLLSSIGKVESQQYGVAVKLGGAVVALVVVAGGGAVYERHFQTASTFDVRVNFYKDNPSQLESLNGTVSLTVGVQRKTEQLSNSGTVLFQGVPVQWLGQPLRLDMDATNHEIDHSSSTAPLTKESPIYIKVKWKQSYASPEEAALNIQYDEGSAVNYIRRPDARNVIFQLRVNSQSDLPVPLGKKAKLEVLSNSGVTLFSTELKASQNLIIPPRRTETIVLQGFIPNEMYDLANTSKTAFITLYYDTFIEPTSREFETSFTFDENTVTAHF